MAETKSVAIVGGGISGLATAFYLLREQANLQLSVFERGEVAGGKVQTRQQGGYSFDWGPNGFLTTVRETLELAEALGLSAEFTPAADAAKRRYLYRDGGLRPLPSSPPAFLKTELLSPFAKVRAALELVLARPHAGEETVYNFLKRHFGRGAADALAGAAVMGITAGDAKELSLDALFPRFRTLEREHGSLIRGMARAQRGAQATSRPDGRLTSFGAGGVGRLSEALAGQLGDQLRTGTAVTTLSPLESGQFELELSSREVFDFDAVVLATPAFVSSALLQPFLPGVAGLLAEIPYADVTVAGLGYDRIDVPHPLDGFGFLAPRGEGVRSLGVLWTSSIFPAQAPPDKVFLRVICGGTLDPGFIALSDGDTLAAVRRDLELSMGITAPPEFHELVRWPRGIPQYRLGHVQRVRLVHDALNAYPGLFVTGNAYCGVGLNDVVRDAKRVAGLVQG